MKTVSQLTTGKKPVGTTAYMGNIEHLMQCRCMVNTGTYSLPFFSESVVNKSGAFRTFVRLFNN